MEMRLELVPLPVADIDRAKQFYVESVGFELNHDVRPGDGLRVVQLTPPGSTCSIVLSAGLPGMSTDVGSTRGVHLVVDDIDAAHSLLISRGVDVSEVVDLGGGVRMAEFADPDGNTWALQELSR
jgi:predicted enzyme related to lactoylglutathione lyase